MGEDEDFFGIGAYYDSCDNGLEALAIKVGNDYACRGIRKGPSGFRKECADCGSRYRGE